MDNRTQASQPGGPFDPADKPRHGEPSFEPARHASAAPEPAREARMAEPAVATDGQMVEAGYGHGV